MLKNIRQQDKDKVLVIGDSLSSDIKGAVNSEIPCVWLNMNNAAAPEDMKIDYVINNISELYKILSE